ncbi:MAG: hypothetical protein ACP5UZ_07480 [Thermoplasmata archaeon]
MWVYYPSESNSSNTSFTMLGTTIMEMNSSSTVNESLAACMNAFRAEDFPVSQGNFTGFHCAVITTNGSSQVTLYFAVSGKYVLFMHFIGSSAVTKASSVFNEQIDVMLSPA